MRRTSRATCRGRRGSAPRAVLGADVLDDLDRVRGGAAVVGLDLHLGRGIDVHDDDGAGMLRLPRGELIGVIDSESEQPAPRSGIRTVLFGREDRRRLGHEVDAAEGDHLGVGGGRLARELERVAGEVGDLLELGRAGSCGRGSPRPPARAGGPQRTTRDLLRLEVEFLRFRSTVGNSSAISCPFRRCSLPRRHERMTT